MAARPVRRARQDWRRARAQGNLPAALAAYQASLAIFERLAKADPGNAEWQRELSVTQDRIGDVLIAQGNLPGALAAYEASLAMPNASPRPTPEMPDGSASCPSRKAGLATC